MCSLLACLLVLVAGRQGRSADVEGLEQQVAGRFSPSGQAHLDPRAFHLPRSRGEGHRGGESPLSLARGCRVCLSLSRCERRVRLGQTLSLVPTCRGRRVAGGTSAPHEVADRLWSCLSSGERTDRVESPVPLEAAVSGRSCTLPGQRKAPLERAQQAGFHGPDCQSDLHGRR